MAKFSWRKLTEICAALLNGLSAVWQVERLNWADSTVQMDGGALICVPRSCEVAVMEEVQLGTDSFYYVWEDTGKLFLFPWFSHTVCQLRRVLAAAFQEEVISRLSHKRVWIVCPQRTKQIKLCSQSSEIWGRNTVTNKNTRENRRRWGWAGHWAVYSGGMFSNWRTITFWEMHTDSF